MPLFAPFGVVFRLFMSIPVLVLMASSHNQAKRRRVTMDNRYYDYQAFSQVEVNLARLDSLVEQLESNQLRSLSVDDVHWLADALNGRERERMFSVNGVESESTSCQLNKLRRLLLTKAKRLSYAEVRELISKTNGFYSEVYRAIAASA